MRTSILCAAFLGLFAAGCAGELTGTGGDDQEPPENCGNGATDTGETCDDGNTTSGDGCSSTCQSEQTETPRVAITVDKPTVMTELNTTTMVTVTVRGEMGFAGNVTLAASATDPAGAPLMGWTVTLDNSTLTIPTNGSATAIATVKLPSQNNGLMGNIKIDATSSAAAVSATSAFTALNQVSINVTNNGTQCVYPAEVMNLTMKAGTTLRFVNKFTAGAVAGDRITIHVDAGADNNVPHEPDPGHLIDTAYERVLQLGTGGLSWYCHAPGPNPATDPAITVVQ